MKEWLSRFLASVLTSGNMTAGTHHYLGRLSASDDVEERNAARTVLGLPPEEEEK